MSKPLIGLTGYSGFIGSTFAKEYEDKYTISRIDLRSSATSSLDFGEMSTLVHCAGLAHQMNGAPAEKYYTVNADLTRSLALAAKQNGVQHFIYLSTAHVYSNNHKHSGTFNESSLPAPIDDYGKSKLKAEVLLRELESNTFKVSIIRPPMVYGPACKGNFPRLIRLVKSLPFLPFGYTKNRRSIIYVSNLTFFISLLIDRKISGIFLPQDRTPLSIQEIVRLIKGGLDVQSPMLSIPDSMVGLLARLFPKQTDRLFGTFAFDSTVTNLLTEYEAPYSSAQGISETSHWFIRNSSSIQTDLQP